MSSSSNKVCFFSFGYSHVFYERLIHNKNFNKLFEQPNIIFIAPTRTYQSFFQKKNYTAYYLSDSISNLDTTFKTSDNYAIASQKKSIINLKSWQQESIYHNMNNYIHGTLKKEKITHLIFSQPIEGLAGILLTQNAQQLNIKSFVPHSCRFLNHSFFSKNQHEEITFLTKNINSKTRAKALKLINHIRKNKQVQRYPYKSVIRSSFIKRLANYLNRIIFYEKIDFPRLKISLENNFSIPFKVKYFISRIKTRKYFTLEKIDQLPDRFIFFPLQYTPESSINIPNPFFVDQLRLIDLIRFNMPNDFQLVIKENPSMNGRRKPSFFKELSKKSGVRLASDSLNTFEIMSKSKLVISVSGTACLEAFIIKKPSIVFGKTFFAPITNIFGIDYNNLKSTIDQYLNRKISENEIEESISRILENTFDFKCGAVDVDKTIFSDENINAFIKAMELSNSINN